MNNLIFYTSGGLGNRLNPILNIKNVFDGGFYLIWPKTMRLNCDFHDVFDNDEIKIITQEELLELDDVDNYHGSGGGLAAAQHESNLNGLNNLFRLSQKYHPKTIGQFNSNHLTHKNTIVFFNNFIGEVNHKTIIENFKKLKPNKQISERIKRVTNELGINKSIIGIHGRATDFVNERIDKYYNIVDSELKTNKDQIFLFCSDDPQWEKLMKIRYPKNVLIREVKDNVYKANNDMPYNNNVMTPLEAVIDGYVDIVLLSKTNFKYFNTHSTFGSLVNILQNG